MGRFTLTAFTAIGAVALAMRPDSMPAAVRRGTGTGLVDYVTGLWTARGREPVQPNQPARLLDALAAVENGIQNPGSTGRLAAAKAQLFTCLRNHLDLTESKALTRS